MERTGRERRGGESGTVFLCLIFIFIFYFKGHMKVGLLTNTRLLPLESPAA